MTKGNEIRDVVDGAHGVSKKKSLIEALKDLPDDWFHMSDDVLNNLKRFNEASEQSKKDGFCLCPQWKLKCNGVVNGQCPTYKGSGEV